ncbi:MAG: FG-GAP repeat domain-containing protein, partial [Planctomycetota bacterium]
MCARHTPISHRSLSASAFLLVINTGLAFGQEPLFPGRQFKKDAYSPSVVITEVNGDAKKDIVMVNSITHDISVLMGSGDGGFGVAMNYSVSPGINPYSLAMGDFNGDGKADVATGNWNSQDISILLNAGTGSFGAPGNFSIGKVPVSIAIGDANGDGNLDIATADYYSNTASILLGSGTGTLGAASHFNVGTSPLGGLAFGDLSGDGNADLVTTNLNSNDISILLGDGLGSFAAANNISVGTNPYSIEIGDFDGDGNRDLIITIRYPGAVVLLMGTGAGAFAPPNYLSAGLTVPMDLAIADIDGDSRLDLLISESTNLSVLLGNGLGAFASPSIHEIGNFAESIVLDDINSDGRIDLAAWSMGYRSVTVLLGKAFDSISGPFITVKRFVTGGFPKHAAIVDMNADGNPDVVTENSGGNNIYLLLGDGAGSLGASSNIHVGFTPGAFTVGDLNADGNPDLIT